MFELWLLEVRVKPATKDGVASRTQIPAPKDSGADGKQAASRDPLLMEEVNRGALPLVQEIEGIAARGRGFGNDVANAFVVGTMRLLDMQNRKLECDLKECRAKLDVKSTELANANERKSILEERLASVSRVRKLMNFAMVVGTLLLGLGFDQYRQGSIQPGLASAGLGLILVLLSWFATPEGKDR